MALFKSGNPALKENTFEGFKRVRSLEDRMTFEGTVNRAALLLLSVFIPAIYIWNLFNSTHSFATIAPYFWIGLLGGLLVSLILVFNKQLSPYLAIAYAAFEGLVMGGLSSIVDSVYPGIALQAILLTFGIFTVLLLIYTLKIIEPSENFKLIIISAASGIALYYLISLGLSLFGIRAPLIHDNSILGILFSLFVVVIAALNLVVDFDFIEQGIENNVPKYMEWYGAFGLIVTLLWLYVEILRLLFKLRR